ncbi:MAG: acyltransferase [Bacteroidales bacterium]
MNSFYSIEELKQLGLKSFGKNVLVSRKASIYSPGKIEMGDHVRIDDFCILSGEIKLGNYIHISAYSALFGRYGIEMQDYSGISPHGLILSASDDFSGNYLINPMIPEEYTHVTGGKVLISKYVQIGSTCVVMPDLTIHEGSVIAAMSFVNGNVEPWSVYGGIPAKFIKNRSKELLEKVKTLEEKFYDG